MIPILVETFRKTPFISFKRDRNLGNFLVRSALDVSFHLQRAEIVGAQAIY